MGINNLSCCLVTSRYLKPTTSVMKLLDTRLAEEMERHKELSHLDYEDGFTIFDSFVKSINKKKNIFAAYCPSLIGVSFFGETSNHGGSKNTDRSNCQRTYNLGYFLRLMDLYLRSFEDVRKFTGNEQPFLSLLKLVAVERRSGVESRGQCYRRLLQDKNQFVRIYHRIRGKPQMLNQAHYWGTRQQLRAGKAIADWIDVNYGQLDPIFGVLLCPTTGLTGPGDSRVLHALLFDDSGPFAYHSAVHDAFGYLKRYHDVGPGYNYLPSNSLLSSTNPCSGQISGLTYWSVTLRERRPSRIL